MKRLPADEQELAALRARVERLESLVEALSGEGEAAARPDPPRVGTPPPATPARPARPAEGGRGPGAAAATRPRSSPHGRMDWVRRGEDWVGKVGVGLLFLGLAFLYRYAVEQGWIVPWLRVGFGLVLGGALVVLGLRRLRDRPRYSQVLLGGGVAVLYLTGWAAQVLYGLVPWAAGFGYMVGVTVLAFALADHRRHEVLAAMGVAGGLATPFILVSPDNVSGLVAYSVLILGWSAVLQVRRGWESLWALNFVAGFAVMALAADSATGLHAWSTQAGIVFTWGVASMLPFAHLRLHQMGKTRWTNVPPWVLWLAAIGGTLVATGLTNGLWDLGRVAGGVVMLAFATAVLASSLWLRAYDGAWRAAVGSGAILFLLGTYVTAGAPWYPLLLALEAWGLLLVARRAHSHELRRIVHFTFGVLALIYLQALLAAVVGGAAGFGDRSLAMLGAIGIAAAVAVTELDRAPERMLYLAGSYAAFIAWLAWVLTPLPGGHGLTSAAWGACALVLLDRGVRRSHLTSRIAGLATLGAVAAKLLIVDLSALGTGLRIVLFLGFGGVFVALGFVLKGRDAESAPG